MMACPDKVIVSEGGVAYGNRTRNLRNHNPLLTCVNVAILDPNLDPKPLESAR